MDNGIISSKMAKATLYGFFLCLLAVLLAPAQLCAQERVKLSGRVIDEEQNPVIFAIVKAEGQAAERPPTYRDATNWSFLRPIP